MPNRLTDPAARHLRRPAPILVAVLAVVAVLAFAGLALARSFTLEVKKHATVVNMTSHKTTHETIITNSRGFAVYWLTGDSKSHPECTKAKGCFTFWPPVTAASAKRLSKAPGIRGKLTSWSRNGFTQAVLAGHPLYTFAPDKKKGVATGEGIVSFGGTWHVALPSGTKAAGGNRGLPPGY
jgi:predicted lipoprotein with Yx(FWY)xxD motif